MSTPDTVLLHDWHPVAAAAGALADPAAALVTCAPSHAWLSGIDGRIVVERGELAGVDLGSVIERHNRVSRRMLEEAGLA